MVRLLCFGIFFAAVSLLWSSGRPLELRSESITQSPVTSGATILYAISPITEKSKVPIASSQGYIRTPPSHSHNRPIAQTGHWEPLIIKYSKKYGINPRIPIRIAICESGMRATVKNPTSSAYGLYQIINGTAVGWGLDRKIVNGRVVKYESVEAHVDTAVWRIAKHGTYPWNASKGCWR